jgi:RimJ/RimL family protein N-acetyltransferase
MIIRGEKVILRPMTVDEVPLLYQWATQSEAAPFWYGEMVGEPVPTYEQFGREFPDYYFDSSQPEKGRSFAILIENRPIGEINYNEINRENNSVDLDIIIAEDSDKNKGLGTDALMTLARYLFQEMNIELCWLETITRNPRAIRAYEKARFKKTRTYPQNGIEWVRMELSRPDPLSDHVQTT